ncbi:zinc ribbon domain-containing protein [Kitasatospora sp. NBC_01250]|uniref:NADase-type glycan-binding domain-containing protein n=1 Tax=Kitasatospora sp. NBC_01250 TaxID=2903571 RepID=UPI002E37450B|nr:zinc-ribbon domain-containing protein [Kitasatospora sp. NBC_01250]
MRTCPDCGTANGDGDDFCGNCGAYLGWSRAGAAAAPEVSVPDASVPDVPAAGDPAPGARAPEVRTPDAPAPEVSAPEIPGPEVPAPQVPAPAAPPRPGTARTPAPAPRTPAPAPRTPAPPAPGDAPRPPAADPVAVQPARAVAPRPVVRPSAAEEAQDGPPCPRCGTPNRPDRRFCRRCAAPLTVTAAPRPLPWWRTRWPFRRRVRIGGSGLALRRMIVLLVLAALVIAGILLYPAGRNVYQDTLDKLRSAGAITPTSVSASAELPDHPAAAADDGLTNTYWGAPDVGASITFAFRSPFRLVDLIIHTGDSADPQQYQQQARPTTLDLQVTTSDGRTHDRLVTLNDKPGPQTVTTGISDVVRVTLVVRGTAGAGPGRQIALAEVEFFKRG